MLGEGGYKEWSERAQPRLEGQFHFLVPMQVVPSQFFFVRGVAVAKVRAVGEVLPSLGLVGPCGLNVRKAPYPAQGSYVRK